jgi:alpha-L-fucosidase
VFDVERGQLAGIRDQLWQNDTSVSKNSWGHIANQDYKTPESLVGDLVDVVSKNGALLLNIGPKPDGTIPMEEQRILREIGAWLKVNGEAVYGTRPWRTFGEGPTKVQEGAFTDTNRAAFTGNDFRFTTKDGALYAFALAWPGSHAVIKSLKGETVIRASLLGHRGDLITRSTADGLVLDLPTVEDSGYPFVFKIEGPNLTA